MFTSRSVASARHGVSQHGNLRQENRHKLKAPVGHTYTLENSVALAFRPTCPCHLVTLPKTSPLSLHWDSLSPSYFTFPSSPLQPPLHPHLPSPVMQTSWRAQHSRQLCGSTVASLWLRRVLLLPLSSVVPTWAPLCGFSEPQQSTPEHNPRKLFTCPAPGSLQCGERRGRAGLHGVRLQIT